MKLTNRIISMIMVLLLTVCIIPAGTVLAASDGSPDRMGGSNRYETAAIIASQTYDHATVAILASGEGYADALAAAPLAHAIGAPILLTSKDNISNDTLEQLRQLGCECVLILGGTAVVSDRIYNRLESMGYLVSRIGGANRYETAVMIAITMEYFTDSYPSEVFIACGTNYPDALAASPAAALKGAPILYSPPSGRFDDLTGAYIMDGSFDSAYILGGTNAVGSYAQDLLYAMELDSVTRLGGSNRYDTAVAISRYFDKLYDGDGVSFATGLNYPDALAGSVFAAQKRIPILLTDNQTVDSGVKSYIDTRDSAQVYVFGGNSVVSDRIIGGYFPFANDAPSTTTTTVVTTPNTEATTATTAATTTTTTAATTTTSNPTTTTTTTTSSTTTTTTTTKPTTTTTTAPAKSYEQQVLDLVNQERAKVGLSPLSGSNAKLNAAAEARAEELIRLFSHSRPDGSQCFTALDEYGVSYWAAGENIAMGQPSPEWVMDSWMNSDGHRANILSSRFSAIGIGYVYYGGQHYWVQMFIG